MTDGLKEAYKDAQKYAQDKIMITCCKCHGNGTYIVPRYEDDCVVNWVDESCEVCHGTGKISLQFYEDLQKGCRR